MDQYAKGGAVRPTGLTVKTAVTNWLDSQRIKPTTRSAYKSALAPVIEMYGSRQLQKVTKADVEKLIVALQEGTTSHGVRARTSINPMLARWKNVWADLYAQGGIIPRDVVSLVKPLRKKDEKRDDSKPLQERAR
ncbi:hypothetical protein [Tsukamurella tyrosinosolvens]|uniref:hypothetical protein n=1 Tax=Tsukamurella tyrosinosolvens TaxID=57704 RepID=UPI000C7F370D|nr:hypothetical protein [Tsukamurella tyrosinosolvens]AUN42575.1 hypothetical protein ASU32_23215 [Tsukamurella tyrosinosolvens]